MKSLKGENGNIVLDVCCDQTDAYLYGSKAKEPETHSICVGHSLGRVVVILATRWVLEKRPRQSFFSLLCSVMYLYWKWFLEKRFF